MEKEFVSYKQALAFKQLGFDEPCLTWYFDTRTDRQNQPVDGFVMLYPETQTGSGLSLTGFKNSYKKVGHTDCIAPLKQQVFRWFREKHNLNGILNHYPNTKLWDFSVHNLLWNGKEFIEHVRKEDRSVKYSTYEQAEDACINKIIELLKLK